MGAYMKLDIVIPLKDSEPNHDLRYCLRSLEKYGRNYNNVFVVGHCPKWLKNVIHIPTEQVSDKHISVRENIIKICDCDCISQDFILFNDDFILTQEVSDWKTFCNMNMGTLKEKADEIKNANVKESPWLRGFEFNDKLLKKIGVTYPINFEYHGPMIINRKKRKEMIYNKVLLPFLHKSDPLLFQRSIYGNLYGQRNGRYIEDTKLFGDLGSEERIKRYGFFSVADNLIGNLEEAPKLNEWLNNEFGYKSEFEKLIE